MIECVLQLCVLPSLDCPGERERSVSDIFSLTDWHRRRGDRRSDPATQAGF